MLMRSRIDSDKQRLISEITAEVMEMNIATVRHYLDNDPGA